MCQQLSRWFTKNVLFSVIIVCTRVFTITHNSHYLLLRTRHTSHTRSRCRDSWLPMATRLHPHKRCEPSGNTPHKSPSGRAGRGEGQERERKTRRVVTAFHSYLTCTYDDFLYFTSFHIPLDVISKRAHTMNQSQLLNSKPCSDVQLCSTSTLPALPHVLQRFRVCPDSVPLLVE